MQKKDRKLSLNVLKRLLAYMISSYKYSFCVVVFCIVIGAFATMQGMLFVQSLVDDYIVPLLQAEQPDFTPLANALSGIVVFYIIGVAAAYAYNRIMVNISQGQRQLIAIARAAVADPPVLILDEATSSIDTRTEALVQEGMDQLMKGRTTFVIAHRLSTIRNADCIMVMEQGRIIERGTHDQLIEKKGKYYQLYTGNAVHA